MLLKLVVGSILTLLFSIGAQAQVIQDAPNAKELFEKAEKAENRRHADSVNAPAIADKERRAAAVLQRKLGRTASEFVIDPTRHSNNPPGCAPSRCPNPSGTAYFATSRTQVCKILISWYDEARDQVEACYPLN